MELEPFQEKIIDQLIQQETLLSKLYAHFAEQFPRHATFWENLSREEQRHANLIEKLREAALAGKVFFDEGQMKTYTLNAFISRLEEVVAKAGRGEMSLAAAFSYAVDYESSLIEKKVFSRFDSLSDKAKGTLGILQAETEKHVDRIRKARKEARGQ